MNEQAPREEWGTDLNGNPSGPYVRVLVLETAGCERDGAFRVRDFEHRRHDRHRRSVGLRSSSCGGSTAPASVPIVSCSVTNFKTRFGLRQTARLPLLRWMALGGRVALHLPPATSKAACSLRRRLRRRRRHRAGGDREPSRSGDYRWTRPTWRRRSTTELAGRSEASRTPF